MRQTGLLLLMMGMLLAPSMPALSAEDALQAGKAAQEELTRQAASINLEVESLKQKLIKTTQNIRNTEENLSETEKKLTNLRAQKEQYVVRLYEDQTALGGLATAAQRLKKTSTSRLLLQSKPEDIAHTDLLMKSVIPSLKERSGVVQSQLDELARIERDIADQMQIQSKELNKINKQEKEITFLLEKRRAIYRKTEEARKEQEEEVRKLAAAAENLDDLVLKIKSSVKPQLPAPAAIKKAVTVRSAPPGIPSSLLPVRGDLVTPFGGLDELGAQSKGITLGTRPGSRVITPLAGTVKFAGPFQKYRQILIVEHQGGYHSLIAGLDRIDTVVGASLAAGEPIGTADSASESGTSRVYYELRKNGDPVDPRKFLVAQRKQVKG